METAGGPRVALGRAGALIPFALAAGALLTPASAHAQADDARPALAGATPAQPAQPPAEPTFDINAIDVDGNTLLDETTLETAIYPHMGPGRTRADVAAARDALLEAYRTHGFQSVVVEVPRQTVAAGVVKLHVVEAPVGRLRVVGSTYHSLAEVKAAIPALAEGQVPDFNKAQAEITEANRLPDRQVTPVVHAGEAPGTIDVDLKVTDQEPVHGSLELNNENSPYTTPLRLTANIRYDNLWQLGHSVSATYVVAPQNRADAEVFAGSYVAPLWNTPFSLLLFGFNSNSNVAALGGVDVLGKGHDIGVRAIYQAPTFGAVAQSLSFGIDYKHFASLEAGLAQAEAEGASLPPQGATSYWPLTATYTLRRQTESTTTASLGLTANLRGLGDNDAGFDYGRYRARASFIHANLDVEHTQPLPLGFQGDFRFSGQVTNTPLISSEQFSLGGYSSVRGYLEAEFLGDDGAFGSIELRSPVLFKSWPRLVQDFRLFTFLDGGDAWVLFPQTEQESVSTLYSTGVGSRFRLLDHLDGDVFAAFPLKNGPTRAYGDRAYTTFSLKAEF